MELIDFERQWKDQEKRLTDSLSINEKLIKEMTTSQTLKETSSIKRFEMANMLIIWVVLFIFVVWMMQYGNELIYLLSGIISSLFISVGGILSFRRLKMLSNLEQYYGSVTDTQRKISTFEKQYYRNKKIDLMIMPIWIISFFPIMMKGLAGLDITAVPTKYIIMSIVVALVFAYILAFILYHYGYKEKMKNITAFLSRLNDFEQENRL